MKQIAFAACLTVLAFAVAIQAQTPPQTQTESVEQELIKLENDWLQAFFKKDIAFSDRFLADDYMGTDEHGNVKTKAQEIAEIKAGAHLSTSGVQDNIKVRVYGDAAVVTGRNIMKGLFKGKEYSSPYLWTDTFIKRGGRWQCVASHVSKPISEQR
jgi:ketosteroid isomerase-like protein